VSAEATPGTRARVSSGAAEAWTAASRFAVVALMLLVIFVVFSVTQADFLTSSNIQNLLSSVSILFVISIGMTFVVLTGGIDLSVGSLLALSGLVLSKLFNGVGLPIVLAVLVTIAAGALIGGFVNGVLIGRVGLSFFVVTLGTLSLYRGIVNIWSGTKTTYINSSLMNDIGFRHVLGLPVPIWIMIVVYLVAFVVLRWTYFGRDVYAVGGNIEAARLSGINVPRTLMLVYAIAGLSSGLFVIYCVVFTVARILHTIFYLNAMQPWRTIAYTVGALTSFALMVHLFIGFVMVGGD